MMINAPAFAAEVIAFILIADLLIFILLWILLGGVFTTGLDLAGRPIEMSILRKIITTILLLAAIAYLALQAVLFVRFLPYWTQDGATDHQRITAKTITSDPNGAPLAYWVTTDAHRFGVTLDIYGNLWVGEPVVVHYRPADDTLLSIGLDQTAVPTTFLAPSASPAASPPPSDAPPPPSANPSPTKRH